MLKLKYKDNDPLEYVIRILEKQKAEILLKLQHECLEERFTDRQGEVCWEDIPDDCCIEKDGVFYCSTIDYESNTWEAQHYILQEYQQLQNMINFLKHLDWEDFSPDHGALVTVNRDRWPGKPFRLEIESDIGKNDRLHSLEGKPPHLKTDPEDGQQVYDHTKIDWGNLDTPKAVKKTKDEG